MTPHSDALLLDGDDTELLVWNVPNEVINGFKVHSFEEKIGVSESQFKSWAIAWRNAVKSSLVVVDREQAMSLRNALEVTLEELDTEFEIRTGFSPDEAGRTMQKLDGFIERSFQGGKS